MEMNAGALQPWAVRQVTTPRPCSPPTMNAPFAMFGTTAIHLAPLSTSSGMPFSGVAMISWRTTPAACRRAVVSSTPEPANPKAASDNTHNAIPYFFIKHFLFMPHDFVDELVRREIRRKRSGCSAATDQIDDQDYDGDDQQKVDQTATYVETEAEKPQNQKNDKNRPEHIVPPMRVVGVKSCDYAVTE